MDWANWSLVILVLCILSSALLLLLLFKSVKRRRGKREASLSLDPEDRDSKESVVLPRKLGRAQSLLFVFLFVIIISFFVDLFFGFTIGTIILFILLACFGFFIQAGIIEVPIAHKGVLLFFKERVDGDTKMYELYLQKFPKILANLFYGITPNIPLTEGYSWIIPLFHKHEPVHVKIRTETVITQDLFTPEDDVENIATFETVYYQGDVFRALEVENGFDQIKAIIRETSRDLFTQPGEPKTWRQAKQMGEKLSRLVISKILGQEIPKYSASDIRFSEDGKTPLSVNVKSDDKSDYKTINVKTEEIEKIKVGLPKIEAHMTQQELENKRLAEEKRKDLAIGKGEVLHKVTGIIIVRLNCVSVVPNDTIRQAIKDASKEKVQQAGERVEGFTLGALIYDYFKGALYPNWDELVLDPAFNKKAAEEKISELVERTMKDKKAYDRLTTKFQIERGKIKSSSTDDKNINIEGLEFLGPILGPIISKFLNKKEG